MINFSRTEAENWMSSRLGLRPEVYSPEPWPGSRLGQSEKWRRSWGGGTQRPDMR